jgi:hypothetical protein
LSGRQVSMTASRRCAIMLVFDNPRVETKIGNRAAADHGFTLTFAATSFPINQYRLPPLRAE